MVRTSTILCAFFATLAAIGMIVSSFDVAANEKDKKEVKDKKEDPKDKKDYKKEVKKDPFKPDQPQQEFAYVVKGEKDEKGKTYWVTGVAFANDDSTVAVSYRDNTIKVWDLSAKKEKVTIKEKPIKGMGEYRGLLYSHSQLFVGSGQLLKLPKEKEKEKPKEIEKDKAKDKPKEVKERPFRQGEIKNWNANTGKPGPSLFGHNLNVEGLAVSKDGMQLASASDDGAIKVWDLAKGKDTQTIKGHVDTVTGVSFSADGKRLVSTGVDRTVRVWNIAEAKELASFKIEREIEVKDAKGKVTKQKEVGRDFTRAVFTPDGAKIIAANRDGMIKIYEIEGKKELQEIKAHDGIVSMAFNADGSKFATGGYDGTIKIWSVDAKEQRTIKAHVGQSKSDEPGTVTALSFSPNGQWLASGGVDGLLKIWSLK